MADKIHANITKYSRVGTNDLSANIFTQNLAEHVAFEIYAVHIQGKIEL